MCKAAKVLSIRPFANVMAPIVMRANRRFFPADVWQVLVFRIDRRLKIRRRMCHDNFVTSMLIRMGLDRHCLS